MASDGIKFVLSFVKIGHMGRKLDESTDSIQISSLTKGDKQNTKAPYLKSTVELFLLFQH